VCLLLQSYELILHEGSFKVVGRGSGGILPYKIRYMGIFLVIETRRGMAVSWDRKTSVVIRLKQHYKVSIASLGDSSLRPGPARTESGS
jgi:mucin-5B